MSKYCIKNGKFGPYFAVSSSDTPLSLNEVLVILNETKKESSYVGKKVKVYNRYLFARPVVGTITMLNVYDGSYQITFDRDQFPGMDNINKNDGKFFFPQECQLID